MVGYILIPVVGALLLYVSFAVGGESASCAQASCEVLVRIDSGPVCGRVLDAGNGTQYYSFRGIPYGKPPLGDRRFQELEDPEVWDEPLYALVEGPACPQRDVIYGHISVQVKGQSEDCIYANVHVPKSAVLNYNDTDNCNGTETTGLPILVFIHGGGFNTGSGNTDLHGPEYLILKGVIVITFNYRLNVFGFLSLNSSKIPGNAGLRDMVTLLRWVQRNAQAFGGNPDNVTLMGQSAGAANAHLLSISEAAEGLFKRCVLLSGTGIPNFFAASPKYAKTVADSFLEAAGINSTDPEVIHQELIDMPLYKIMYANDIVQYNYGIVTFVPVVEEDEYPGFTRILDDEPISLIGKGRGKDIPILISFTTYEVEFFRWIFMYLNILKRIEENPSAVLPTRVGLSVSSEEALQLAAKVHERYFNDTPTMEEYMLIVHDIFFKYPAFKLAEWRAALQGAPIYLSKYSYVSNYSVMCQGLWQKHKGPIHVEDLTYLFHTNSILGPNVAYQPDNTDDQMKDWMTTLITNFMLCSNPTCMDDETSPWPPVYENNLQYYINSQPMTYNMTELAPDDLDMIQFYDGIDSEARNLTEQLCSSSVTSDSQ